jgi:hypothetical protein
MNETPFNGFKSKLIYFQKKITTVSINCAIFFMQNDDIRESQFPRAEPFMPVFNYSHSMNEFYEQPVSIVANVFVYCMCIRLNLTRCST